MSDLIDPHAGPTLEVAVTEIHTARACDLWRVLELARPDGVEVRVKFDWNGINSRAWDMSFVPWERPIDND
jgi:hypothetical protein